MINPTESLDLDTEAAAFEIETLVNRWLGSGRPLETLFDCMLTAAIDLSVDGAGAAGTAALLREMAAAVEAGEMGDVLTIAKPN